MRCFGVGIKRCLVLLKELLLDSDVMVGDAEDDQSVLRLTRLLWKSRHRCLTDILLILLSLVGIVCATGLRNFRDKLILDQDEGLHRVLEGELVLAHLGQYSANIQVDVAWVRYLKAIVDSLLTKVQIVVFYF